MNVLAEMVWIPSMKAAGLVLLVLLVQRVVGERLPPAWLHGLWSLVFLRLLLPVLPESPWSLYGLAAVDPDAARIPGLSAFLPLASPAAAPPAEAAFPWGAVLAAAWASGFLFLAARRLRAGWRLEAELRRGRPVSDERLLSIFAEGKAQLGLSRPVELLEVPDFSGPATCGIRKPRIVLPAGFGEELSDDEIRHVLLHELSHVKRGDVRLLSVAGWLEAVHWFNPLVRWARRRFASESEAACDAAVLHRLAPLQRPGYGLTLLRLSTAHPLPAPLVGMSSKHELKRRIQMISSFRPATRLRNVLAAGLVAALAAIALTDALPATAASEARPSTADLEGVRGSVVDIRTIGTAMFRWLRDQPIKRGALQDPGAPGEETPAWDWRDCKSISHRELEAILVPDYLDVLPAEDPWRNDYEFCLNPDLESTPVLGVRGRGSDGRFEGYEYLVGGFPSKEAERDIVWSDGYFVTWPTARKN